MRITIKLLLALTLISAGCQVSDYKGDQLPDIERIRSLDGDICIRNVTIIDPVGEQIMQGMDIIIRSGIIEAVHTTSTEKYQDIDLYIQGEGFYALPGFVNTHTHLWQHLSRSVSPSEQLQQWIPKVYLPSNHVTESEFFELNLAACHDALLHGITSVNDWTSNAEGNKFEQVLNAMIESGVGGAVTWPHTAVFLPSEIQLYEFNRIREWAIENERDMFVGHLPPERIPIPFLYDGIQLARKAGAPVSEHVMENVQCQRDWHRTVTTYLAQYGDQLQHDDLMFLREIAATPFPPSIDIIAAMSQNARIVLGLIDALPDKDILYNKEDIQYLEELAAQTGPTYIPFLEHLGAFDNGYLSVHSSLVGTDDMEILKRNGVVISHNPESNAYLSSGIAPISSFMQAGIPVTIGTDGSASNDRIDMLSAMRLMSHLQKVVALNVPLTEDMNSWGILRSATIEGARALNMEDRIGSIIPGKEADIVLFNGGSFGLNPVSEIKNGIADLIVNSAEARDIFGVIADGRIVVWDNQLVHADEEKLSRRITEIRANAIARSNRENKGRVWSEDITLTDNSAPFIRYRSVYPNYIINVSISNRGESPAVVDIVFSDNEKAAGLFLADDTKERFPYNDPDGMKQTYVLNMELPPGETISLVKERGDMPMEFIVTDNHGSSETFQITLNDDPEWEWAMRANVYLGAAMSK
jgi:cytosine/adenosine deaminase-related metal-dependent hydrolase